MFSEYIWTVVLIIWYLRFEVSMAVTIKSTIFWDVTPCSLIDVYQLFWKNVRPPLRLMLIACLLSIIFVWRWKQFSFGTFLPECAALRLRKWYSSTVIIIWMVLINLVQEIGYESQNQLLTSVKIGSFLSENLCSSRFSGTFNVRNISQINSIV
jgi:hypothetical protein